MQSHLTVYFVLVLPQFFDVLISFFVSPPIHLWISATSELDLFIKSSSLNDKRYSKTSVQLFVNNCPKLITAYSLQVAANTKSLSSTHSAPKPFIIREDIVY